MNHLAMLLATDIEKREAAFIAKLAKSGSDDLAGEYADIQDLRRALETTRKERPKNSRGPRMNLTVTPFLPEGFVLMEEVRAAIRSMERERFRSSDVFELLTARFPAYVTEDKKGTISATLSNLVAKGELSSNKDGQRKVWYTIIGLREPATDPQPELLPE